MDNKYIEQLRTHVKDALRTDNMRYHHTLGVADRKSTRLNSSHKRESRMPSSA